MLLRTLQAIELGKKLYDGGLTIIDVNKRAAELTQKGYSKNAVYKMIYFEIGVSVIAGSTIEMILTPPSLEAGAALGFEIGFLLGPEASLPGSILACRLGILAQR